ncbi:unnamed protein product [Caenorhabditis angaria]|uniref:glucuronosyltransferase n=1 Tax=Caenorhabditis angaria TaxID=860376 RepID=A0A9P1N9H6_9PELO|nr:unnamed protein product [Caenorhabditis angaria]
MKFSPIPMPWSAHRSDDYGYTIMSVVNQTHLHFQQLSIDKNEQIIDEVWVSKDIGHLHNDKLREQQIEFANSYKILVFSPACSTSHLISNARIADELAQAGHDVTVLEIDMLNITSMKTAKFAKRKIVAGLASSLQFKNILMGFSAHVMSDPSIYDEFKGFWEYQNAFNGVCEEFIKNTEIFEELRSEHFDAYFGEQINMCGFGYAQALGIKRKFLISSCPMNGANYDLVGLPMALGDLPIGSDLSENPTYFERARNALNAVIQLLEYRVLNMYLTDIFRAQFGENFPNTLDIVRESDFTFVATDEVIDFSSPTLQNVIHVGGLGIHNVEAKLPEPYASEMEKGKNGVIYFSLGTIANTSRLPNQVLESFLEIVQRFPDYHFLIRADKYDLNTVEKAKNIKNVRVSDWLPQPAILQHPRLKLFITHAGYNSIMESARTGVPLITIPFMFDQNLNSRAIEKKGWGIRRTKNQLLSNPQAIEEAIREILNNPKYTENAHRIRDLIKSKPQSSSERFLKTVDWVISNNGVPELLFDGRNTNTIIYYNLDILIPIFVLITYFIIPTLVSWYIWSCFGHLKNKQKLE